MAILKKKAQLHEELLSDEIAHYIASLEFANIRELEGALIRVLAFASLTKQELSLAIAQKVLERVVEKKPVIVDFLSIIKAVQKYYACSLDQLKSTQRTKEITLARHITIFLMKESTHRSFRDIGEYLGGRDHSTIMHAYNKVKKSLEHDASLIQMITQIKKEMVC